MLVYCKVGCFYIIFIMVNLNYACKNAVLLYITMLLTSLTGVCSIKPGLYVYCARVSGLYTFSHFISTVAFLVLGSKFSQTNWVGVHNLAEHCRFTYSFTMPYEIELASAPRSMNAADFVVSVSL